MASKTRRESTASQQMTEPELEPEEQPKTPSAGDPGPERLGHAQARGTGEVAQHAPTAVIDLTAPASPAKAPRVADGRRIENAKARLGRCMGELRSVQSLLQSLEDENISLRNKGRQLRATNDALMRKIRQYEEKDRVLLSPRWKI